MRTTYNEKMCMDLEKTLAKVQRRLREQETVIDAKDAVIEKQVKEIAQLKAENAELKGVKSIWNEVEE